MWHIMHKIYFIDITMLLLVIITSFLCITKEENNGFELIMTQARKIYILNRDNRVQTQSTVALNTGRGGTISSSKQTVPTSSGYLHMDTGP